MALLQANTEGIWFDLPTPKPDGYFPTYTHLENSYRDARGYLHRDIIRKNTAKVNCTWNALTLEECLTLQNLYNYEYFYLRFSDCYGNRVEKKVYAGAIDGKILAINHQNYRPEIVNDVSMNFVEY